MYLHGLTQVSFETNPNIHIDMSMYWFAITFTVNRKLNGIYFLPSNKSFIINHYCGHGRYDIEYHILHVIIL